MSFDADDEILQDFLVEASEILEELSEQLVELEHSPDDSELLNTVFRGFHTIKGGGSFLSLTGLVQVCHSAEDLFNLLRNGELSVNAGLMDVVLRVLDVVNEQFDELREGTEPSLAPPELLQQLEALKRSPDSAKAEAAAAPEAEVTPSAPATDESVSASDDVFFEADVTPNAPSDSDEITDEEFENLLDLLQGEDGKDVATAPASDEITDDEFEALLDQLHGKTGTPAPVVGVKTASAPPAPGTLSDADEISEDEFEALLDKIHGKSGEPAQAASTPPPKAPATNEPAKKEAASPAAVKEPVKAAPPPKAKKPTAPQGETTVRVDTSRLDDIMNMVGELVLVRNRLATLEAVQVDEEMAKAVANLDVVTADLQSAVMKTRMQPIKKVFGRFPRVVRDLARSLKKEVDLVLQGEETDLDKNLVEALADPLVHLVRNAVDHGIEMPDSRVKAGKERAGTVTLSAEQEGDHILLTISDDGGGMDADVLRKISVEKGVLEPDAAARLSDQECFQLIFAPGFSTKAEISDISGRGVGMDVVKTRIVQLNGSVEISSELGVGTTLQIKVPLTLAIMPTLMVSLKKQIFALPLVNVNEIFHLDLRHTNVIDGQCVIMVREKALPLFYLADWLVGGSEQKDEGHVVVVSVGSQKVGFVVDQLVGQEEVVIKPLGNMLLGTGGLAGATIRGDGKIALILDVPSLMKSYA
ncbi:MAG: chemotaxis protein CheA [Gammaproteobacteria bacterium]|nr:chemotaxis protein CheA [Gammaproteobacteria bacterium]MCF6229478.1 chemotaxis protein CheA [Gammaproteobacteria bacterium]